MSPWNKAAPGNGADNCGDAPAVRFPSCIRPVTGLIRWWVVDVQYAHWAKQWGGLTQYCICYAVKGFAGYLLGTRLIAVYIEGLVRLVSALRTVGLLGGV